MWCSRRADRVRCRCGQHENRLHRVELRGGWFPARILPTRRRALDEREVPRASECRAGRAEGRCLGNRVWEICAFCASLWQFFSPLIFASWRLRVSHHMPCASNHGLSYPLLDIHRAIGLFIHMHRTTILLPEDLRRAAVLEARSQGLSLGELIRRRLQSATPSLTQAPKPAFFTRKPWKGNAPNDLSANHDQDLYGA